jgi:hypothetical protein
MTTSSLLCLNTFYPSAGIGTAAKDYSKKTMVGMFGCPQGPAV